MKGNFIDIIIKKIKIRTYFLCPYLSCYFQTINKLKIIIHNI